MAMCFEDALSDDNMMKLDWNYLGWARLGPVGPGWARLGPVGLLVTANS